MPNVLITGASSGIGAALAREYARRFAQRFAEKSEKGGLALLARRRERLDILRGEILASWPEARVEIFEADVTDSLGLDAAIRSARSKLGSLDTVIANAGFGVAGRFERLTDDDYRRQFETNVFGLMHTVRSALPALKESKGRLVLMGSVNSYLTLPKRSPYCMSKYAVRALAEALTAELKRDGISVTLICPGLIESEIRSVNNQGVFHSEVADHAPQWLVMPAATAARKIARAVERRRAEYVVTVHGKILVWMSRFVPGLVRGMLKSKNVSKNL